MSEQEPLITTSECARRLGVNPSTVLRHVHRGVIPAIRLFADGPALYRWSDVKVALKSIETGKRADR